MHAKGTGTTPCPRLPCAKGEFAGPSAAVSPPATVSATPRSPRSGRRGAVVGRLPKPRRAARPATARQFFALSCHHMGWEVNDRAQRLAKQRQDEREAFDLVRIQGTSPSEAADVLEVSVRTVNRRLHRGLQLLAATLGDLYPGGEGPAAS